MTAFFILVFIIGIFIFLFLKNKKINTVSTIQNEKINNFEQEEKIINIDEPILIDENGNQYQNIYKTREIPRKTYIKANLNGKYWGIIDEEQSIDFKDVKFFDFNIYEVELRNAIYQKNIPFKTNLEDVKFSRERLPKLINTILLENNKEFFVNLNEPILTNIKFNRKLHQDEGNEVFGTINAEVTGYVLDFIIEEYCEKLYIIDLENLKIENTNKNKLTKTLSATGNVEYKYDYKRVERYYSDYKTTYWDNWTYQKTLSNSNQEGCLSSIFGVLGTLIGFMFLILVLPQIAILLPFILLLFLFNIIPSNIWQWFFKFLALVLLFFFIASLINLFSQSNNYRPIPVLVDKPEEQKIKITPIVVNEIKDTLITHFRTWEDYDGNNYKGKFWIKKSDFYNSKNYKINLPISENTERNYDKIIYSLKENDKLKLEGLYQLFNTIKKEKDLSKNKFAEMIVSFIQDIPYSVVLPNACDGNLYQDDFIKKYLSSSKAECDGFEKFGINSPVEFLTNLKGDCDTRTLILYTVLSHYNYDVVLFSSEYYNHSILGVNLPYDGVAYNYNNQRYILWETTSANIKPGVLPNEISNLNYWRISLKSK